jgi:hypothetical protein
MVKLCLIMQHINLCTPYITCMLVSHPCIFAIGHVKQGPKKTSEPAHVEGVNPEEDQGKPRCI